MNLIVEKTTTSSLKLTMNGERCTVQIIIIIIIGKLSETEKINI